MPSAAVARLRARIGDLGLPGVVWVVEQTYADGGVEMLAFYDRERALEYAAGAKSRTLLSHPMQIKDAAS